MATDFNPIDLKNAPSLPELVDEVRKTHKSRIIRADGEDVAVLMPAPKSKARGRSKPVTEDDPVFRLIGIGDSGKGDISENKHAYLLRAKRSQTEHI